MGDVSKYLRLRGWTEFDGSWCDWLGYEKTGARKVCGMSQAMCDQLYRDRFLIEFLRENNLRSETTYEMPRMVAFADGVLLFHAVRVATEITPEGRKLELDLMGQTPDYDFDTAKLERREVCIKLALLNNDHHSCYFTALVIDVCEDETVSRIVLRSVGKPGVFE